MFKSLVRTAAVAATLSCSAAAWAGCGLTITFDNDTSREITVLEIDAKTTTGTYQTVHRSDFKVGPGRKVAKAIETNAGCALPHNVRGQVQDRHVDQVRVERADRDRGRQEDHARDRQLRAGPQAAVASDSLPRCASIAGVRIR